MNLLHIMFLCAFFIGFIAGIVVFGLIMEKNL